MSQSQSPLKRQDAMKDLGMTINSSITHPASIPAPQPIEVDANGNKKNGGKQRKSRKSRKSQKSQKSQKKRNNKKSAKKKSVKRR